MKRTTEVTLLIAAAIVTAVISRGVLNALCKAVSVGTGAICYFDANESAQAEAQARRVTRLPRGSSAGQL